MLALFPLFALSVLASGQVIFMRYDGGNIYLAGASVQVPLDSTSQVILNALTARGYDVTPNHLILKRTNRPGFFVTDDGAPIATTATPWRTLPENAAVLFQTSANTERDTSVHCPALKEDTKPASGITNYQGNSCFLLTVVQCLYHIPEFAERLAYGVQSHGLAEMSVSGALNGFLMAMDASAGHLLDNALPTFNLLNAMSNYGIRVFSEVNMDVVLQSDSSELLQRILDIVNQELVAVGNPFLGSYFDSIFKITMNSGPTDVSSYALNLNAPFHFHNNSSITLSNLIRRFFEDPDVPKTLKALPPHLFVSIGRGTASGVPLLFKLDYPLRDLDLTQFVQPENNRCNDASPYVYDLTAVVVRTGASRRDYCLMKTNAGWFEIDDARVTRRSEAEVQAVQFRKIASYLLYRRRV